VSAGSLAGRTVLVTREEPEGGPLSSALAALGAAVRRVPVVETLPPLDPAELAREASRLAEYDWVVFTSARAVEALAAAAGGGPPARVVAVGEGTARAARAAGWEPRVIGGQGAVALAAALGGTLEGRSVLFPCADRARPETAERLREAGAQVRTVTAYRTLAREGAEAALAAALAREDLDAATFTSPSAADVLARAVPVADVRPRLAAIGRSTAERLRAAGARDVVVARKPTFEALAGALARALAPG
jgi:uroporphyrinogen-III synthase